VNSKQRARPLSPEERRQSIVDAVTRLILDKGSVPTTSEIASAGGVAEGTIYSVFPDKHSIFHAVIEQSVDPTPTIAALSEVHEGAPLERQLAEAVRIMQERLDRTINLIMVMRSAFPQRAASPAKQRREFMSADAGITAAIVEIFDRSGHPLTMPSDRLAMTLRTLVFASAHPLFGSVGRLTVDEIVTIVLAAAGLRTGVA
jgi:AcrR family transcriptional regulator